MILKKDLKIQLDEMTAKHTQSLIDSAEREKIMHRGINEPFPRFSACLSCFVKKSSYSSGKDCLNGLSAERDFDGLASGVWNVHVRVNAETAVNRGADVSRRHGIVFYKCGLIIRSTVERATTYSGSCKQY